MNVLSLLNSSSEAAGQQKESQAPPVAQKNRTPWDAGGYSLPTTVVAENSISGKNDDGERATNIKDEDSPKQPPPLPASRPGSSDGRTDVLPPLKSHLYSPSLAISSIERDPDTQAGQSDDSHTERSIMAQHKASDSRSSLASFTSSLFSTAHSRLSSTSTIATSQMEITSYPLARSGSKTGLAEIPSTNLAEAGSVHREIHHPRPPERPTSPSDAMLIKRTTLPALKVITGEEVLNKSDPKQLEDLSRGASRQKYVSERDSTQSQSHKRAVSAPDPSFVAADFTRHSLLQQPRAELTPPLSHHPDQCSPATSLIHVAPATPPVTMDQVEDQSITCMYIANCDTGSQPRKAISHIFGRNKMCTRKIPQHVWVHYCRKHYQRSRYRNPKEYAKLQCDLVQQQIRRVRDWSDNNVRVGQPGVVQDWGLAIRKREQKRLDDMGTSNRKRRAATLEQNESDDGENEDEQGDRRNSVPLTAVPEWLLALCGKGYSTSEILDIFSRLHSEILEDRLPCFPDIEILPNIVADEDDPDSPHRSTKRRSTTGVHRRSQSLSVASVSGATPSDQSINPPTSWVNDEAAGMQRRERPNGEVIMQFAPMDKARVLEVPAESSRRLQKIVHHPVFANIDENNVVDGYGGTTTDEGSRVIASDDRAPLPARELQGKSGPLIPIVTELEPRKRQRVGTHQRSQSDVSYLHSSTMSYSTFSAPYTPQQLRPTSSHSYGQPETNGYRRSYDSQGILQISGVGQVPGQHTTGSTTGYPQAPLPSYDQKLKSYTFQPCMEGSRAISTAYRC